MTLSVTESERAIDAALYRGLDIKPRELAKYFRVVEKPLSVRTRNYVAALLDGRGFCTIANYVRTEAKTIPAWLRDHIAELLDTYPTRQNKIGRHPDSLTIAKAHCLVDIEGIYNELCKDLWEARRRVRKDPKRNGPERKIVVDRVAKELRLPEKIVEDVSGNAAPSDVAFKILAPALGFSERAVRDLYNGAKKRSRAGIFRRPLTDYRAELFANYK